jgi:hypothetical protein
MPRSSRSSRSATIGAAWLTIVAGAIMPASTYAQPPKRGSSASGASSGARGWSNHAAFELAKEAIGAHASRHEALCAEKARASLAIEEHPLVRLHLAVCLGAQGKIKEGLASANTVLSTALATNDVPLRELASERVSTLLARLAHVKLALPKSVGGLVVTFNRVPVRPQQLRERIALDPGEYAIEAERVFEGDRYTFSERVTLKEGEERLVEVLPTKTNLTEAEKNCLERSKTYDEKLACIEHRGTKPVVKLGAEVSGYTDDLDVHVLSPAIDASVASPTAGWHVGGSYLVDVVSAASPDLVSMASPPFKEVRHAASLSGGAAIDLVDLGVHGDLSREPDYLSLTGGGDVALELDEKRVVPRVGYSFSHDRVGIRNTPLSQFERHLATHAIEAGVTLVVNKETLVVLGLSAQIQRGEQSKLYRFVPVFDPAKAKDVRPGESADDVNRERLNVRPRELLPDERDRYALGARMNHRLPTGTLRADERLYTDTWGIQATTTDARYVHDLGDRLRLWPHLRVHVQTGADFYRLAYPALLDQDGAVLSMLPYRSGDRELSPMMTLTGGGGARIALTSDEAGPRYALVAEGEVMWSKFFRSLFVTTRTAVYGTLRFEVEL